MARLNYKGTITTTGRSEALRLDKALFKAHPEFKQRARINADVIGPGSILITLASVDETPVEEGDAAVLAYLSFLERDMIEHPDHITPFTREEIDRLQNLTHGISVSDDDIIPDDVSL